ncbi:MAG: EAL domain-containing protein [Chromatiales bacterium]|nr:EAL domain-containing protein [Chromatiales bacterium]
MNRKRNADIAIDLLIIDQSPNSAEQSISTLRNAGLVIHPTRVSEESDLLDTLAESRYDIILCSADNAAPSFEAAVGYCLKHQPDTPLVIIYQDQDPNALLQAMQDGARDVVSAEDPLHLQLVMKREFNDLQVQKELEHAKQRLKESEDRCTSLVEHSRDAIAYIHDGMHVHVNQAYLETFGYVDIDEIEGLPVLDMIAKPDQKRFKTFLKKLKQDKTEISVNCRNTNDEAFEATLEFAPATIDQEPCTQVIIRSHAKSKELEEKIRQISSQDLQTGLSNRQFFMENVDSTLEQSTDNALFYIVLDNFQHLRSSIGIAHSDTLLKQISEVLLGIISEDEILARFGDHTFTILSKKVSQLEAEPFAEHLRSVIQESTYTEGGSEQHPTCSIGIALQSNSNTTGQEFINQAYQAFEAAKSEGGNQYSIYDPAEMSPSYGESESTSESHGNENQINELIEHALNNDQFRLVFQPIVSLQGDSRENYAVLTRLIDQNGEEILPNHFMKPAEQSGQMLAIDRWVIQKSIQELSQQRQSGRRVNFFVNISGTGLEDDTLLLWICDCLRENKAKGPWLTFQVKDSDLRKHTQAAKKLIDGLKKIKCKIAIDQFGANTNSESLLKHLPVDYVKINNDYMADLATNQDKQDELSELNNVATSHGAKTIAMGVEDANSLAILWTVGVNYIQGYFLQEPSENITYDFNAV